jgi:hypothetical protein
MGLLDEALAAHGGADALDHVRALEIEIRAGGLAFEAHGVPADMALRARIDPREPKVEFTDFLRVGRPATFAPDRVTVGDAERRDPRRRLGSLHPIWDHLDLAYFTGYALWNYVTTPWLLTRARTTELPGRRLRAEFPPEIPTHSRVQTFHFDALGLLTRVDYTAYVFGAWARAAHVCSEHRRFGPIVAPTVRRVTPRIAGRVVPEPTLVHLHVVSLDTTSAAM